jgi:hypothetical protein
VRQWALNLATAATVALAALAYADDAFATQRLTVSQDQKSSALALTLSQAETDRQPAKIQIYVPSGYSLNANVTPGTTVGTASGDVIARDQADFDVPVKGDIVVDDPAKHTSDSCSPGTNLMVLVLQLTVAGQPYDVPVYVNQTTADEAALGATRAVVCLDPTDTPLGSPNRSPFGAQLKTLTMNLGNLFAPPTTTTRWSSLWTPYEAGTGVVTTTGTVEARAYVGPGKITLSRRILSKAKRTLLLTGRVSFAGLGTGTTQCEASAAGSQCPVLVQLLLNGKRRFAPIQTSIDGAYRVTLRKKLNKKKYPVVTAFFQTTTSVATRDMTSTGCAAPALPAVPCVSAVGSAFTAVSQKIKVRI